MPTRQPSLRIRAEPESPAKVEPCKPSKDELGFEKGRGPVFSYEDTDAVILHSKLAAAVIDTVSSMQKAMSAARLRST